MTDLEKAARLALEMLESCERSRYGRDWLWPETAYETAMKNVGKAITALRAALATESNLVFSVIKKGNEMAEVLNVSKEGKFTWIENADEIIDGMPDNEAMKHILKALRKADEDAKDAERRLKAKLIQIHDVLTSMSDTDLYIDEDMTDEEVKYEYPDFWAAKEIAMLIGDAPWDQYAAIDAAREQEKK